MGVHQREGRVVADRADVADVVGNPLELGHERPQPLGAGRGFDAARDLDRAGVGERVGDRAVAGGPPGQLTPRSRVAPAISSSIPLCT